MPLINDRARQVSDAAIAVIAGQGMRALTHRAVDAEAGVPTGTTSNYFRSRRDLLRGILLRIAEQNTAHLTDGDDRPAADDRGRAGETAAPASAPLARSRAVDHLAERIAAFVDDQLTTRRGATLARMACEIEVASDPDLREILHAGAPFPLLARKALLRLGVPDPDRAAAGLIAVVDGLLYDRLVGVGSLTAAPAGTPRARDEVAAIVRAHLTGVLADRS